MLQRHAGDSYGYRFEANGRSVIYTTDSEHKLDDPMETESYAAFFRDADVVIFDAMYSLADAVSVRADWGHSSNVVGVELCQLAGAKHLCLFHHEPSHSDQAIDAVLADTRRSRRSRGPASRSRSARPTTAWKSSCESDGGVRTGRAPNRAHPPRRNRRPRGTRCRRRERLLTSLRACGPRGSTRARRSAPRTPKSAPAVIVEIDQKSLKAIGQWPWPRSVMAELVEATHRHKPAALALDIVMPEVDASSPERLLARAQKGDAALAAALADSSFERHALARRWPDPTPCSPVAGMPGATGMKLRAAPFHRARLARMAILSPRRARFDLRATKVR
jgi:hypothetical protein